MFEMHPCSRFYLFISFREVSLITIGNIIIGDEGRECDQNYGSIEEILIEIRVNLLVFFYSINLFR